jgi:multiple sugar transport system permease protein
MSVAQPRTTRRTREIAAKVTVFATLLVLSIPFLAPLFWLASTALKTPDQIYLFPPRWIPNPMRWENFIEGWTAAPFTLFLRNTMITTFIPMLGEVFVSAMAAYSFSRVRWPGRDKVFFLCLATMLMPSVATFIPVFLLFRTLGWVNTFLPLVVPAFFGVPFYIFMLRQFMLTMPRELDEAARVDGANTIQIFTRITLPLIRPALATVAIFSFMAHWNDFFGPVIYLQRMELKTLTLGLATFESMMSGTGGNFGLLSSRLHLLMAVSLLICLPCILVFLLFQRYFVRDVLMSGLKG